MANNFHTIITDAISCSIRRLLIHFELAQFQIILGPSKLIFDLGSELQPDLAPVLVFTAPDKVIMKEIEGIILRHRLLH